MENNDYKSIKRTDLEKGLEGEKPYIKLLNCTVHSHMREYKNYSKRPFSEEVLIYIKNDLADNHVIKKANEVLEELPSREKEILKLRSGFNGEPQTLEQIAKQFSLTRERIRAIEDRAQRMFRRKYNLYDKFKEQEKQAENTLRKQIKYLKDNKEIFSQKVEDLNFSNTLSTRIKKVLKDKGIEYISDLIQKREYDFRHYKNLGVNSIEEIKKVLSEKGLCLGIKMEDIVKYFR